MSAIGKAVIEELILGLHEHYHACRNPVKNHTCLIVEDPDDMPCNCSYTRNLRRQIKWIEDDIKRKANLTSST